ncbi:MAG: GNAT family N-acetyltransferase [Candidatus Limnocylindrales bacterium]
MPDRTRISIVEVTDEATFESIPPCADPRFDHRSCDYWEDAARGSKAARRSWLTGRRSPPREEPIAGRQPRPAGANPFLADAHDRRTSSSNPFAAPEAGAETADNPFLSDADQPVANPFAPRRATTTAIPDSSPLKLQLLARGLGVTGSRARVLLLDDHPAAYCQFGPLTAYPRAQRTRDLYPALPDAPLPAVITCIATTAEARDRGFARQLVVAVCDDLAERGFAAVETYPEIGAQPDATSAATPAFWESVGFHRAAEDERFPVMRRELA